MSTDAELIAGSVEDPVGFAGVFDRHYEAIARFLSRRVGRSLAEELASETFIRAFAQRHQYDLAYPDAAPWLYGIANNLLGKHAREEDRRRRAYARDVEPAAAGDEVQQAQDRVDAVARGPAVAAALARLRPAVRDTLLLFALGDLDYEGISRATKVPVGTVRSRLHRARRCISVELCVAKQTTGAETHDQEELSVSNDIDLELVRRLHPEEREGRDAARERARADLLNAMHAAGRVSGPPPARRRLRLITLGSTAAALAAGLIVAILLLTATSATAPAYALTRHSDGTLTLKFYRLTNDIPALNARLARMGIDETVVPVTPQCANQAPIYPIGSAQSTIKLYVGRKYLAPGFQGVLGAERLPDGKIALVQGAMKPWEIPSCFATLSNTNIGHLVIPTG